MIHDDGGPYEFLPMFITSKQQRLLIESGTQGTLKVERGQ